MANAKLKVTFVDIDVSKDGDPIDRGEIYYSLKVDGAIVADRSSGNPYKIGSGGTIQLGNSTTVTKADTVGTKLVMSGSVSEKDSGVDETDIFVKTHTFGDKWGTGTLQSAPIADKNLNATVHYLVERV
jgi:hypothetical protein